MFKKLKVETHCPHCQTSLMNEQVQVDNYPSIELIIRSSDHEGKVYLSSVYGSYNYICNIDIPSGQVCEFFCPHCHGALHTEQLCPECHAPMVSLELKMGGKVDFCSRAGCKKHMIEIENLEPAIGYLFAEFGFQSEDEFLEAIRNKINKKSKPEDQTDKEIIHTGAFLRSYCPHCGSSLIKNNMITFKITNPGGEEGFLKLAPYLNIFTNESTIRIPENSVLQDIRCPVCEKSLIEKGTKCEWCGSPVAKIHVAAITKMISFYICTKKGCHWHGISGEDRHNIILEDSEEW